MTRKDYDVEHLIGLLRGLKSRYPHLRIILEPGSAFAWQTGALSSEVVDIVENRGIRTAILNVSFTCHMPDCLPSAAPASAQTVLTSIAWGATPASAATTSVSGASTTNCRWASAFFSKT